MNRKWPSFSVLLLTFFSLFSKDVYSQSYGLGFRSHDVVADKRTSLELFPEKAYASPGSFEISFEISFLPDQPDYYGYIFRFVENGKRNIDLVYNKRDFRPDIPPDINHFKLILNDHFTKIAFSIDQSHLMNRWNQFQMFFNMEKDELTFVVNDHSYTEKNVHLNSASLYKMFWGINSFDGYKTSDCPPFKIRNIKIIHGSKLQYFWPLNETGGNVAHEIIDHQDGHVSNPLWIRSMHHNWSSLESLSINGTASVAYNAGDDLLYIIGTDSLWSYSIKDASLSGIPYSSGKFRLFPSNESVYNNRSHTLYNYYIDNDHKKICSFNFKQRKWQNDQNIAVFLTDYWHTNNFFSAIDTSLYILGGYGQLTYKNTINRYHIPDQQWSKVTTGGDYFCPRYLAALGTTEEGRFAYILGGYGSLKGQQILNSRNLYDFLKFDVKTKTLKKIYELKIHQQDFVFANSLVINEKTKTFYALMFGNYTYNSHLQLIKGSLEHPEYQAVGDSIPYDFHDTHSFANLYFSPRSQKLVAVTLLRSEKANQTTVKLYTLLYPPDNTPEAQDRLAPAKMRRPRLNWIVALIVTVTAVWLVLFKFKALKINAGTPPEQAPEASEHPVWLPDSHGTLNGKRNAIFLFGDLQFLNTDGVNITKKFSPLLKELFLVVLIYSLRSGRGISPDKLLEILWFDKSEEDAKNNRSANISKLKSLLHLTGHIDISKETGNYIITIDHSVIYTDYYHYLTIIRNRKTLDEKTIQCLIEISGRGAFLPDIEYSWLDPIKSEICNEIVDVFLEYFNNLSLEEDGELLIRIANCIFSFDPVNEEAMIIKCKALAHLGKHSLAKSTFENFQKEYKDLYGEEFKKNFNIVLGSI